MLSAEEASRIGLVNKVVPAEALSDFTMNMALTIAGKSTMTVATRQTSFLPAARDATRSGLRLCLRSDGGQHAQGRMPAKALERSLKSVFRSGRDE